MATIQARRCARRGVLRRRPPWQAVFNGQGVKCSRSQTLWMWTHCDLQSNNQAGGPMSRNTGMAAVFSGYWSPEESKLTADQCAGEMGRQGWK